MNSCKFNITILRILRPVTFSISGVPVSKCSKWGCPRRKQGEISQAYTSPIQYQRTECEGRRCRQHSPTSSDSSPHWGWAGVLLAHGQTSLSLPRFTRIYLAWAKQRSRLHSTMKMTDGQGDCWLQDWLWCYTTTQINGSWIFCKVLWTYCLKSSLTLQRQLALSYQWHPVANEWIYWCV